MKQEDNITSYVPMEFPKPFEMKIDINGYKFYWNIIKLNCLQKLLLRLLGIKITKFKEKE